ncbi:DUF5753 domain-containing protein [Streptomyces sp. L2]|uniref:DUF5753 domain-containing protein n=1 Tax=Streptomyces sp. L2 TaxID=2162665 RepID=UPI0010115962|nr:DUF5753 domain-containing protein [Streptomyces sp. L2]
MKREHTAHRFDHCLELEVRAARIQAFGASLIPGLPQTKAYMRELFLRADPGRTPQEIDGLVAARLGRQEILRRDCPPDFWWILGEATLRQAVGGPAVMREQLTSLLPLVYGRHTTIQVAPFQLGACALMNGTLIMLTLPDNSTTVYHEGPWNGEIYDDQETVRRCMREYDRMKACALSPHEPAALIEAAMETYEPCESPGT